MATHLLNTLILASTFAASLATVPRIPVLLEARGPDPPVWVSVERAVKANGALDGSVFRAEDLALLRRNLQTNEREWRKALATNPAAAPDDCHVFSGRVLEHFVPNRTFDELLSNASSILTGEVVAKEEGFFQGRPGSLLLVRAKQYKHRFAQGDLVLVFTPSAHIRAEGGAICARPLSNVEIGLGDRLIAFGLVQPVIADGYAIFQVNELRELVVEQRSGRLRAPAAIAEMMKSFEQIETEAMKIRSSTGAMPSGADFGSGSMRITTDDRSPPS